MVGGLTRRADERWAWHYDPALSGGGLVPPAPLQRERFRRLACPTLVLRGAESEIFGAQMVAPMAADLPRGRVVSMAGAGHWAPMDDPVGFLATVRAFLAEE